MKMEFIYNGKKRFGNKFTVLLDIAEQNGIILDELESEILVDRVLNDEIAQYYYTEGVLNLDKFVDDPEAILEIVG